MLYGMLLAGALCCPLSAVPLTGPLVKRRESFFHPDITSACPSVWATLEGVQCPWRPPLSSSFPSKLWQSNPFFGVVSYCLMPLWDRDLLNELTQHAEPGDPILPCHQSSNCIKHLHASHNNIEVGTLKADTHPVINTNQSPDSSITLDSAALCVPVFYNISISRYYVHSLQEGSCMFTLPHHSFQCFRLMCFQTYK